MVARSLKTALALGLRSSADSSDREKTLEKRPVALQRHPQVFRRHLLAASPLPVETAALLCENLSQPFHHFADKRICLLDSGPGLVHEACLDTVPPCAKAPA